jgi:hypothetical protein
MESPATLSCLRVNAVHGDFMAAKLMIAKLVFHAGEIIDIVWRISEKLEKTTLVNQGLLLIFAVLLEEKRRN